VNSKAQIVMANLKDTVENPDLIRGKRVLCIEDGPTLTHGGLPSGAAYNMAEQFGAREVVDPRDYAVGSLKSVFDKFTHLGKVLPAMGYSDAQMKELEKTINNVPCDLVVIGTPVDLGKFLDIERPSVRVKYEIEEVGEPTIRQILEGFRAKLKS
jgi:predicted GTPase